MKGPTEEQLEELEKRHESYVTQRETFAKIPSSAFSILGISNDEVYCRTLKDRVSKYYFCSGCDIKDSDCNIKKEEVKSHS